MTGQPTPFGKPMLKHWMFDPAYKNLNHGSFGAHPIPVKEAQRAFLDIADVRPDPYIRRYHAEYLDEAREAVAKVLNAQRDECVFVKNATTGVSTVLYNLAFQPDEALIYFEPVYGAVEKGVVSLQEHSSFPSKKVSFQYPITENELERRFREVIRQTREEGLKVRASVFDAIVSNPGVRFPFELITAICREEGILSVIDAAHGIGNIHLDMAKLQPDFFVSNCHNCAVLYTPRRNQHLIRSTVPTSWGFIPAPESPETLASVLEDPNAPVTKTAFEQLFEFVATSDDSAYICVPAALKFRAEVCGGEDAIIAYTHRVANEGADAVAAALGTDVLQEPDLKPGQESRMRQCALTTVRLPIAVATAEKEPGSFDHNPLVVLSEEEAPKAFSWIQTQLLDHHNTFLPVFRHGPWLWTRLSGQTYLEKSDFESIGVVLRDLCERVAKKEFKA
ncbi:Aminotransferase, class V/Cysteine desulfurase [Penicillium griseofulvum]|uniref:Aminotransferase, class V/Cysteine desulfurase n=1 Tax=Penicillium patulum TaxID=5078 RepID=A0A135LH96_PENPA|nr:Aminotransferase, class V/Cysteine desulfurase [Penicillium griseofulvum]KXG48347.1 Aminotransferase, class V/Cysteine desulfurase [Penicillium griseofulvum]